MKYTILLAAVMSFVLVLGMVSALDADADSGTNIDTSADDIADDSVKATAAESALEATVQPSGITRAYYGHGWITAGDTGQVMQMLWFRNKADNLNALSDGDRELAMRGGGILRIGTGSDAEVYRLTKVASPDDAIAFIVSAYESKNADDTTKDRSLGTLMIERDPYSKVSTWKGTLFLESDDMKHQVTMGTRSVPVEDMGKVAKLIEERNYNGFSAMSTVKAMLSKVMSVFQ